MVSILVKLPSVLLLYTKYYSNVLIHKHDIFLYSKIICSTSVHTNTPTPFGKYRTPSSYLPHDSRQ